jgi:TRAP-type uncharacterized transport system substrate-binding protein
MLKPFKRTATSTNSSKSIFDHHYFKIGASILVIILLVVAFLFIKFIPDLSHVNIRILSGAPSGNYYSIIDTAAGIAKKKKGEIENISTNGSMDNIKRLSDPDAGGLFALSQNGMPW